MKTLLIILSILTFSCNLVRNPDEVLSEMKSPVIIIGINNSENPSVSFKDALGKIYTTYNSTTALSMVKCRKIGDTIK